MNDRDVKKYPYLQKSVDTTDWKLRPAFTERDVGLRLSPFWRTWYPWPLCRRVPCQKALSSFARHVLRLWHSRRQQVLSSKRWTSALTVRSLYRARSESTARPAGFSAVTNPITLKEKKYDTLAWGCEKQIHTIVLSYILRSYFSTAHMNIRGTFSTNTVFLYRRKFKAKIHVHIGN